MRKLYADTRPLETNAASALYVSLPAPGCEEHDAGNGYREQQKLEHSIASVWCETKQPLDEIHVRLLALVDCASKKMLRTSGDDRNRQARCRTI